MAGLYHPGAAPGFGDVQRAVGTEREATGAVEPAHDDDGNARLRDRKSRDNQDRDGEPSRGRPTN